MCSPSAPPAPDPYAVSAAQTTSNADTARLNANLNRVNTTTPWGSQTFTNTPGTDQWSQNITLSPDQQKLLDTNNQTSLGLGQAANGLLGQVQSAFAKPLDYSSAPARTTSVAGGPLTSSVTGGPLTSSVARGNVQSALETSGLPQLTSSAGAGLGAYSTDLSKGLSNYRTDAGPTSQIQTQLQPGQLPDLTQDYSADRTKVENALYSRLEPQLARDRSALDSRLANQGITQGSEAYNNAIDESNRQSTDARNSVILSGGQEQSRLADLASKTRSQLFGESAQEGTFANAAQGQQFSQGLANANLFNDARKNLFGENLAGANLANDVRSRQYTESMGNAQLGNAARGQGMAEALSAGNFANSAQGQDYTQRMGEANLANSAEAQQFSQGLASAGLGNAAQGQQFAQGQANAGLNNQSRDAIIAELMQQQNAPLNALSALRSGSQVAQPNFPGAPQTQVAGTNVAGNIYNSAGLAQGNYAAQMAQQNSLMGGLASLGSAAIFSSDRRLKHNIERIGTHKTGVGLYKYQYRGEVPVMIGVMADEVERVMPAAVVTMSNGFKAVNYSMIGGV